MISTERLFLREMNEDDFEALTRVLSDPENMQHYPEPFDEERVRGWIRRNQERYKKYGFGLYAVCLKDTEEVIGDCGLTLQMIHGQELPEIGYHIRRDLQRQGYAKEAAAAARDHAFEITDYDELYSYCKYTNAASYKTAEAIGMTKVEEYEDDVNTVTYVSRITRTEWIRLKNEEYRKLHKKS